MSADIIGYCNSGSNQTIESIMSTIYRFHCFCSNVEEHKEVMANKIHLVKIASSTSMDVLQRSVSVLQLR